MASESMLTQVYATDEDIAIRAYGDFTSLVPSSNLMAQGTDGVFSSGDLWTLTSASMDFATLGVQVSHVVQLTGPPPTFKGAGQLFAVGVVAGNSITLRRVGKPDATGLPPSPSGGLTGVSFTIKTFDPQIEDVSYEMNTRFGLDPAWAATAPGLVYDLRVLRQVTALSVLVRAYTSDTRSKDGDFARKLGSFSQALSAALGICQIRWAQAEDTPPPSSYFGTRIGR